MSKLIVTHMSPDLDAITSSWLIKRYLPGWDEAEHAFVPAGETYEGMKPDENPDIIHVDTGLGRFDHHQFSEELSATKRVFDYLAEEGYIKERDLEALEQMTNFVTTIDNFGEVRFPDPTDVKYTFCLHEFIYPLRGQLTSDHEIMSMVMLILDSILFTVKNNLKAEGEIKEGVILKTPWGKTLVMETKNEAAVKYALKKGYEMVVRRDPENNTLRIKTQPDPKYNLTSLYEKMLEVDGKATWFLHASKHMLLNGSSKNPNSIPSSLTVQQMIAILKKM
ncbi:chromate resistance protein [Candidatus Roizmanbacteria bacterium]|nr:MAG: chromate resistance protein [Candidatus Roizmanbacteria bacterium]